MTSSTQEESRVSPTSAGRYSMSEALSVADVLDRAADLIEPEGAWTQRSEARRADGSETCWSSDEAVCWCLEGAYTKAGGKWADSGWEVLHRVVGQGPIGWNDSSHRAQAEVVAKLREAAAKAREQSA
jgi:hypothetical protein